MSQQAEQAFDVGWVDPRLHRTWYRCEPRPVLQLDGAALRRRIAKDRGITEEDALAYLESCRNQGECVCIDDEIYRDRPPMVDAPT
jgi:hypothetical protein